MNSIRPDLKWAWIDDDISTQKLEALGIASENCIRVCLAGPDELVVLKEILHARALQLLVESMSKVGRSSP